MAPPIIGSIDEAHKLEFGSRVLTVRLVLKQPIVSSVPFGPFTTATKPPEAVHAIPLQAATFPVAVVLVKCAERMGSSATAPP
eukprot:4454520-Prorocentrum_lima.AAC.1